MRIDDISWDSIILEAPNNKKNDEEELTNDDYEDADMDIEEDNMDEESESENTDKNTNNDDEENPEENNDIETDDSSDNDTESNPDVDTDENVEDEQNDSGDEQNVDDTQNKYLIRDFIELYNRIDEILNTLIKDKKLNSSINPTYRQIKHNIEKIKDVVYDYIADKFVHETYI